MDAEHTRAVQLTGRHGPQDAERKRSRVPYGRRGGYQQARAIRRPHSCRAGSVGHASGPAAAVRRMRAVKRVHHTGITDASW